MRILSWNVHGGVGRDGRFDPGRIADVIAGLSVDFVALQEVQDREYRGVRVSDYFGQRLHMHAYPGPTLERDGSAYGNLLLARQAAQSCVPHDLSVHGREPRGAIEAEFLLGGQTLRLVATHFGLTARERARQLDRLLPVLTRDGADLSVLAGDLNEWRPGAAVNRALRRLFGALPRRKTFPARAPALSLDRICVLPAVRLRRLTAIGSREARVASDHLPLLAEIAGRNFSRGLRSERESRRVRGK